MIGVRSPQPDFHEPLASPAPTPLALAPPQPRPIRWKPLAALAAAAVIVGALWFVFSSPMRTSRPATPQIVVAGFAEDFVFTFLSSAGGDSEALAPFLGYSPSLAGMAPGDFYVTHVAVRDLQVGDEAWDVIVRADLLERTDGGYAPAEARHFAVRVLSTPDAGLRAGALPTPVAAPFTASVPAPEIDMLPNGDATVRSVADYVEWYLTGTASIGGLEPAGGFAGMELVTLDLGPDTAVAGVAATTAGGHTLRVDLPLVRRNGAWQVPEVSRESS